MYQPRSPIVQAANATPNVARAEIFPSTASAPATTSVGTAGTGRPTCSTSTLPNTRSSPYWAMSRVIYCTLQRLADHPGELADNAAAERHHADHEDHALRHGHPGAELREVVLHRDDDERPDDRPEHRAEAAEQHHQDNLARHGP